MVAGPNDSIWDPKMSQKFGDLFWSDHVNWKKNYEESVTIIVAFHLVKLRQKIFFPW